MGQKKCILNQNTSIEPCPKCGNNTEFTAHSEYCAEDCCSVWVVCKCGFDATDGSSSRRLEDVWGSLDKETILMAFDVWNQEIVSASLPKTTTDGRE